MRFCQFLEGQAPRINPNPPAETQSPSIENFLAMVLLLVTIKHSFVTTYKWKKHCSGDIGSFDSFRSKFFATVIWCFKSFALNKYDLRSLSSVFLIEIFDLRGKKLKYAKELLLNHYRKSTTKFYEVAGHVDRVKTVVTNHLRKMFPSRTGYTRQHNAVQQPE